MADRPTTSPTPAGAAEKPGLSVATVTAGGETKALAAGPEALEKLMRAAVARASEWAARDPKLGALDVALPTLRVPFPIAPHLREPSEATVNMLAASILAAAREAALRVAAEKAPAPAEKPAGGDADEGPPPTGSD
jgi:hypothetical protein